MHSDDHRQWEHMMGDDAMNELLLSGNHPWLNRAVESPARLAEEFIGPDGWTYTEGASIRTMHSRHPDSNAVIVYPTIRMNEKTGKLESLSDQEAFDEAIKKGDYIQTGGDDDFGYEISKGISNWLQRRGAKK